MHARQTRFFPLELTHSIDALLSLHLNLYLGLSQEGATPGQLHHPRHAGTSQGTPHHPPSETSHRSSAQHPRDIRPFSVYLLDNFIGELLRFPLPTPVLEEDVAWRVRRTPAASVVLSRLTSYCTSNTSTFPSRLPQKIFDPERFNSAWLIACSESA